MTKKGNADFHGWGGCTRSGRRVRRTANPQTGHIRVIREICVPFSDDMARPGGTTSALLAVGTWDEYQSSCRFFNSNQLLVIPAQIPAPRLRGGKTLRGTDVSGKSLRTKTGKEEIRRPCSDRLARRLASKPFLELQTHIRTNPPDPLFSRFHKPSYHHSTDVPGYVNCYGHSCSLARASR